MADAYSVGGGGGRATPFDENDEYALSKPYDLEGLSADTLQQINEMFDMLFKALTRAKGEITDLSAATGSGLSYIEKTYSITDFNSTGTRNALLASPGARVIIVPVHMSVEANITTVSSTGGILELIFDASTFHGFPLLNTRNFDPQNVRSNITAGAGTSATFSFQAYVANRDPRGKGLALRATTATTGGTGTISVGVHYYTINSISTET